MLLLSVDERTIEDAGAHNKISEAGGTMVFQLLFDNARPLAGRDSMTVQAIRPQPKSNGPKFCRWSSLPELSSANLKRHSSSTTRSSEDMLALLTKNSVLPRSSDTNLWQISALSHSKEMSTLSGQANGRWDLSTGVNHIINNESLNASTFSRKNCAARNTKNLFDLSMSGLGIAPTPTMTSVRPKRRQQVRRGSSAPIEQLKLSMSGLLLDTSIANSRKHSQQQIQRRSTEPEEQLKMPQRKHSIELADRQLTTISKRLETTPSAA